VWVHHFGEDAILIYALHEGRIALVRSALAYPEKLVGTKLL
jgi:hypothetical protein